MPRGIVGIRTVINKIEAIAMRIILDINFDVAAILPRNRVIALQDYLPPRPPGTLVALADAPAPDVPAIESF